VKKKSITELNRLSAEDFKKASKIPLVVILDNIRSLHNVGSIFRTSDAFRVEHLYLCGLTATPPHPEIHKTALGAELAVEWSYIPHTLQLVQELKQKGFQVFAIEQVHESLSLQTFQPLSNHAYALVLGHEVFGVDQSVIDACDGCLEIPQYGTKHSLNVSVTAGIVIWEFYKAMTSVISL
jgi:tRNA G18 (ribose-2'-O)-methylase SpoU